MNVPAQTTSTPPDFYTRLPKVELHRHLEGSLRLETVLDVIRTQGITIPMRPDFRSLVQMQPSDPLNVETFLSKFQALRLLYRSPEIIYRITREAILDAAADQVRYMELRFSPVALSRSQSYELANVMDWVAESAQQASQESGVLVRLIASVNRHEPLALAEKVAALAVERQGKGIVGLDLTGNEAQFPATPFLDLFRQAQAAGLHLTVHAGEWNGAHNVREAIEQFQAERIGHGVRILEDANVVALAHERGTPFEVCITSNYQTGVTRSLQLHPVRAMLSFGLNVTLNTDDPSISQITLADEYRTACSNFAFTPAVLAGRIMAAAQASFLPETEKANLAARLQSELDLALSSK